jgi:gamma-tubulin complex component 2
MLNFVQNFQYYVMFEVVEPNWQSLEEDLRKVSTIDDVLDIHTDFLDRCLKDTMLTNTELLRIIHQLLTMCITFSNRLQREDTQFGMIHEVNETSFDPWVLSLFDFLWFYNYPPSVFCLFLQIW